MSFLRPITDAIPGYPKSDSWARDQVSTVSSPTFKKLFDQVAQGKLVRGFDDYDSFSSNAHKSDVAVCASPIKGSSERFSVEIRLLA